MRKKQKGKFYNVVGKGWFIDTRINIDGKMVHISKRWFSSLKEAQEAYGRLVEEEFEKAKYNSEKHYDDFKEEYLDKRSNQVAPSTLYSADCPKIAKYIDPFMSDLPLSEAFDEKTIRPFYKNLKDSDGIVETKNKVVVLFKDMLKYAYNMLYIDPKTFQKADVYVQRFKKVKAPKVEKAVWTEEECQRFLDTVGTKTAEGIMMTLFVHTACRIGEFLALMPKCFDWEDSSVRIFQQVCFEHSGTQQLTSRLKSDASYRTVYLPKEITAIVKGYVDDLAIKNDEYLFKFNRLSKVPLSKTSFRRKFKMACDKAGVQEVVPHSIRHFKATQLSKKASTIADHEAISAMLGHTPAVDLNTYASHDTGERARTLICEA